MVDPPPGIDPEAWQITREIWAAAGKTIPETPDKDTLHFHADLKRVLANFEAAKAVSERDRNNELSFNDLADHCRELYQTLYGLDEIAFMRLAGSSTVDAEQVLTNTMSNLSILETACRGAKTPGIPRKRKHEHNEFFIILLANLYQQKMVQNASGTTNPITDRREGKFVEFVMGFVKHFVPDQLDTMNGRAIQRALKVQRDNPDPLQKA